MSEDKKQKVVPIGPGEAHLQNEILKFKCHICGRTESPETDMVLLKVGEKQMAFKCIEHEGVVQDFIRQYQRPPLGWIIDKKETQVEVGPEMGNTKD